MSSNIARQLALDKALPCTTERNSRLLSEASDKILTRLDAQVPLPQMAHPDQNIYLLQKTTLSPEA